MTEFGVFAGWPGPEPSGMFIPWGEVRAIRQAAPAAAPPHLVGDHGA
jgi:hypothetical protein